MTELAGLFQPLVDRVDDALAGAARGVTLRWGTVTQVSPLRVKLDADADALPFPPASAPSGLVVGDRVRCSVQNLRVTVESAAGRGPATLAQVKAGLDTKGYVTPATLLGWKSEHVAGIPAKPTSVEVTAGTATVREDGLIAFAGVPMLHLNGIFAAGSDSAYKMVTRVVSATAQPVWMRGRNAGTTMTSTYNRLANSIQYAAGPARHAEFGSSAAGYIKPAAGAAQDVASAEATFVKSAASSATQLLLSSWSSESGARRLWEEYSDFSGNYDGLTIAGGSGGALTGWARFWKVA